MRLVKRELTCEAGAANRKNRTHYRLRRSPMRRSEPTTRLVENGLVGLNAIGRRVQNPSLCRQEVANASAAGHASEGPAATLTALRLDSTIG